jgi:hypothetical protein
MIGNTIKGAVTFALIVNAHTVLAQDPSLEYNLDGIATHVALEDKASERAGFTWLIAGIGIAAAVVVSEVMAMEPVVTRVAWDGPDPVAIGHPTAAATDARAAAATAAAAAAAASAASAASLAARARAYTARARAHARRFDQTFDLTLRNKEGRTKIGNWAVNGWTTAANIQQAAQAVDAARKRAANASEANTSEANATFPKNNGNGQATASGVRSMGAGLVFAAGPNPSSGTAKMTGVINAVSGGVKAAITNKPADIACAGMGAAFAVAANCITGEGMKVAVANVAGCVASACTYLVQAGNSDLPKPPYFEELVTPIGAHQQSSNTTRFDNNSGASSPDDRRLLQSANDGLQFANYGVQSANDGLQFVPDGW